MTEQIALVEVGPRDGLQNDPGDPDTDQKLAFIARLEQAGARRIESGAFVSPKAVPKMADSDAVFAGLKRNRQARHIALALNETGVRRAIAAGCDEINFVLTASEGFGLRNQGMTPQQSVDTLMICAPLAHAAGIGLSATVSVAFGDPYTGDVDPGFVAALAAQASQAGLVEIAFGDTIGVATPWDVRRLIKRVRQDCPSIDLRMHFHNTRGTGLANVCAALETGVAIIDASCGGIGGCPFAPGASGNIATEDVVYMLDRAGIDTGLDLDQLINTARWLETILGHPVHSSLRKAGGFPEPRPV